MDLEVAPLHWGTPQFYRFHTIALLKVSPWLQAAPPSSSVDESLQGVDRQPYRQACRRPIDAARRCPSAKLAKYFFRRAPPPHNKLVPLQPGSDVDFHNQPLKTAYLFKNHNVLLTVKFAKSTFRKAWALLGSFRHVLAFAGQFAAP